MALTKIRQANRKYKHEQSRKRKRDMLKRKKLNQEKSRREIIRQRRGQLEHRAAEINYVKELEDEVLNAGA